MFLNRMHRICVETIKRAGWLREDQREVATLTRVTETEFLKPPLPTLEAGIENRMSYVASRKSPRAAKDHSTTGKSRVSLCTELVPFPPVDATTGTASVQQSGQQLQHTNFP